MLNKFIEKFIRLLNEKYQNRVRSFGIVGPYARNQQTKFSDVDFYMITKRINPFFEWKIKKKFFECFRDCKGREVSLLIASPTIFKKPDLMFFEYTNSGKVLFGEKIKPIPIERISRFEAFRNIIYRSCFFLEQFEVKNGKLQLKKNIKKELFLYNYSKVIQCVEEVCLLLTREYVADNFKRSMLIKRNVFAKQIPNFIKEHQKIHLFKYENLIPKDFSKETYTRKAFFYLQRVYEILFKELFDCKNLDCKKFNKIKAPFPSCIGTRLFFTLNWLKQTKQIKIHLFSEPFVCLTKKFIQFVIDFNSGKSLERELLEEILNYWKCAGWFYYYV